MAQVRKHSRSTWNESKRSRVIMGILRDDVPVRHHRWESCVLMRASKPSHTNSCLWTSAVLTSLRILQTTSVCEKFPERERSGWCGLLPKSMYGTRDAAANCAAIVHGHADEREFVVGHFNPCLCKHASKDIRRIYHFVTLADENDLQWNCERNDCSIDRESPWSARWR